VSEENSLAYPTVRSELLPALLKTAKNPVVIEGEEVDPDVEQQRDALFSNTLDVLGGMPFYRQKGGLNEISLFSGEGEIFNLLVPEAERDAYREKTTSEKRDYLSSKLAGVEAAGLEDMLKSAGKGLVEGIGGSQAALQTGRLAFQAAPVYVPTPFFPPAGFLAKPVAGVIGGVGGAIGFSMLTQPLLESLIPDNQRLLPGEENLLEGIRTTAQITGGIPAFLPQASKYFAFRTAAEGPGRTVANIRDANASLLPTLGPAELTALSTRGQKLPRTLRLAAFADEAMPRLARYGKNNPGKLIAAETAYGLTAGTGVAQLEAANDPIKRAMIELGAGFLPYYSVANLGVKTAQVVKKVAPTIFKLSPTRMLYRGPKEYFRGVGEEAVGAYDKSAKGVRSYFDQKRLASNEKILKTREGRIAVQKLLDLFIDMGENPAEVAKRIGEGDDFLDNESRQALSVVLGEQFHGKNPFDALPLGVRVRSAALTALQNYFESGQKNLQERDKQFGDAVRLQTALIKILGASGDKDAMEIASNLRRNQLEVAATETLVSAATRAMDAARRVGTKFSAGLEDQDLKKQTDLSAALSKAFETQISYGKAITSRLYREAAIDAPPIRVFLDKNGQEVETPRFIEEFDSFLSGLNDTQIARLSKDGFFKEAVEQVNLFKAQLGMPGSAPTSKAEELLERNLTELSDSDGLTFFRRIVSGDADLSVSESKLTKATDAFDAAYDRAGPNSLADFDRNFGRMEDPVEGIKKQIEISGKPTSARGRATLDLYKKKLDQLLAEQDSGELPPISKLKLNAAGEPLATPENVAVLQNIIDQMPSQGSTKTVRDATKLLTAQKGALQALVQRTAGAGDGPDGVDAKALTNFLESMTEWAAKERKLGGKPYQIAALLKKNIYEDINNTLGDSGVKYQEARDFYKGFNDALIRTVMGRSAAKKGYNEDVIDAEEMTLDLLRGNDTAVLGRVEDVLASGRYLKNTAYRLERNELYGAESLTGPRNDIKIKYPDDRGEVTFNSEEFAANLDTDVMTTNSLIREVLARDIVAPLQKGLDNFEAKNQKPVQGDGESDISFNTKMREYEDRKNKSLLPALEKIKQGLDAEDGTRRKILGEDYHEAIQNLIGEGSDSALTLLKGAKADLDGLKEQVGRDFALGTALNTSTPIYTIQKALNDKNGEAAIGDLVRNIGRAADNDEIPSKKEALEGLRSNLLEYIFVRAGGDGSFDPDKAYNLLFAQNQALKYGGALSEVMVKNKLITRPELDRYKRLLEHQALFQSGVAREGLFVDPNETSFVQDYLMKISAARLGAYLMPGRPGQGTGIVESSAAIQLADKITKHIPMMREHAVIEKLLGDELLLQAALTTPKNPDEKLGLLRYIGKKLQNQAGRLFDGQGKRADALARSAAAAPRVISDEDLSDAGLGYDFSIEAEAAPAPEPSSTRPPARARVPGDQSSIQAPQFKPLAQRLTEAAPAPAPRPTGQANPQQRAGLASLFPNDPILGAGRNVV
jgi:hypothetical protein